MNNSNDNQLSDTIEIIWSIKDVFEVRPELTPEQARKVLHYMRDNHSASYGINWDVLEATAHELFSVGGEW